MCKNKVPTIVCDLDDTISSFIGPLCRLHSRLHDVAIPEYDINDWDFKNVKVVDAFGHEIHGADLYNTMKEYETEIYSSMLPLPDSKYALDIIHEIGYKIIVLTARPEIFRKQTTYNLVMHDIPFDEIMFSKDKVSVIKELTKTHSIKCFIDDNAKTVKAVYENCKVDTICLMERRHNVDMELDEEVKRVGSLVDCIRYLKKVVKRKG